MIATLLERDAELARAGGLLGRAGEGEGSVLVIEGAAGAGKTSLLRELVVRARDGAFTVLSARASELERGFAFGVVRQALGDDVVPAGAQDEPFVALNALFWELARRAEHNPVLLALDDVHWADEPSLRFIAFALGRVESIPALIAVTARPGVEALVSPLAVTVPVGAVGEDAVRALVQERLGGDPDPAFVRACLATTGGNPFLLVELLRALEAVAPTAPNVGRVAAASPENVARSVAARLHRLGDDAARLARALAALGDGAMLAMAAQLAELDERAAAAAADALAGAGLIAGARPLRFEHPLLRTAVEATLAPGERLRLHATAARLLRAAGAPAERIALHLLETDPAGDAEAARMLAASGRAALEHGAPDTAARLLARALEEPPDDDALSAVLLDLGVAESAQGRPVAREHLRRAAETARDPVLVARALRELASAVGARHDEQRALLPLYAHAIDALRDGDRELLLALETMRLSALILLAGEGSGFEREADRFRELPGDTPAECALLGLVARARMFAGAPASEVAELARRAARHLTLERAGAPAVWFVGAAVWLPGKDLTDHLERRFGEEIERAVELGSAQGFAGASWLRAIVRLHTGDLRGAEADALAALHSGGSVASFPYQPLVALTESLGEQGRGDEAEALLAERGLAGPLPLDRPYTALLIARGRMRAARGDLPTARADLEEGLRRLATARAVGVVGLDARLELALIRHAGGDAPGALVDEALAAARAWGADRALGGALHVAGLLDGDVERLREAAALLASSSARLWEARALVDLGAALRRANRRRESREPLRAGLALAERCGATPLAERARSELAASGGRVPARPDATELTASEQRVAELAASGLSNPEIAQRLFVTIKTIEMHLSNAYRKLGVRSRHELPGALATISR